MTVCVSLYGEDTATLATRLQQLATRRSLVELRLDRLGPEVELPELDRARGPLRLLLACVPREQGGDFLGDEAAWQARVLAAVGAFRAPLLIDVPPGFSPPSTLDPAIPRVWSWHEPEGSHDAALAPVLRQLQARAAPRDFLKIVARAERHEQAMRALALLDGQEPRLIAFAQGPGGRVSRVWAPLLGAPWTYASWGTEATAPGQWPELSLPESSLRPGRPLAGVLGCPIAHSRSPLLWEVAGRERAVLRRLAGDAEEPALSYHALEHTSLHDFRAHYAGPAFRAFSVTAPLKEQALQLADDVDPAAARVGAANFLLRLPDRRWRACQTDGAGALRALQSAGLPQGVPFLVLGAGGAARAVAAQAASLAHPVLVAARRPEAAAALVEDLERRGTATRMDSCGLAEPGLLARAQARHPALAVVQATPLGSQVRPGDPLAGQQLTGTGYLLDMVYDPVDTVLSDRARAAGFTVVPGHHMLLEQMRVQFALTYGEEPSRGALGLALEAALDRDRRPILLIGPRAAGKTTLGQALAEVLGWSFVDADRELEVRHGRALASWLPEDEPGFRHAEAALLEDLGQQPETVVALGGGIVDTPSACAVLAAHPRTLGLHLSVASQLARRRGDTSRPALTSLPLEQEIAQLMERRAPLYEKACSGRWISVEGTKAESFHRLLHRLKLLL